MSFFNSILDKLGFGKKEEKPPVVAAGRVPEQGRPMAAGTSSPAAPPPAAMPKVDVVSKLDAMPGSDKLNWRTSIVDLLKLLGLDSSKEKRAELAKELGYPLAGGPGSAEMNMWLHKAVMKKLAENGGNVPPELIN